MKILYSKQRLNSNYKLGIYFLSAGAIMTVVFSFLNDARKFEFDSAGIGVAAAGIVSLLVYHYQKKYQYLVIENGYLKKNGLFGKKIYLSEILEIRKFAGDYVLKTEKTEMTIHAQIIDKDSLLDLNKELNKLDLPWSKNNIL